MKVVFIVNPIAGSGKAKKAIPVIEKKMSKIDSANCRYQIVMTKAPKDATGLAKKAIAEGASVIVAVGGDGTALEVANALIDEDVSFGVIPVGSGNDFAKAINVPRDVSEAIDIILHGKQKKIDTLKINGKSCINISSTGIDAEVVKTTHHFKSRFLGKAVYLISLIINIFTFKPFYTKISIDGVTQKKKCLLVAVCNGMYYGGGFKISPPSIIDDGCLDVVVIDSIAKLKLFMFFPLVPKGKHISLKEVNIHKAKDVVVTFKGTRAINVDGDLHETADKLHYSINPSSLKVCVYE